MSNSDSTSSLTHTWFRNRTDRWGAGVCASIAAHFGWNTVLVRVGFIASLAFSFGLACWVYLAFWAVTPFHSGGKSPLQKGLHSLTKLFTTSATAMPRTRVEAAPVADDSNVARVD